VIAPPAGSITNASFDMNGGILATPQVLFYGTGDLPSVRSRRELRHREESRARRRRRAFVI
jgi:hypothetical protein